MLEIRRSNERGFADRGWLKSFHTFSFADYYDPKHVEFGALRVINEDRVAPAAGFGTHGHRNMEIISYVLDGALAHKDSLGTGSTIKPGDVQRMSAGRGVTHSEYNASPDTPVHFLQIWIKPSADDIDPSYEQKFFPAQEKRGKLRLIASHNGDDESVRIHQNARVYAGLFDGAEEAEVSIAPDRQAYVHVARGSIDVNGMELEAGDGLKATDVDALVLSKGKDAEVLVFVLPRSTH
jgi:quercetin 2,3-dioxygenase